MIGNVVEVTSTEVADNEYDTHYAGKGGSFLTGNLSPVTTYGQQPCSNSGEYPHYGYRFVVSDPTSEGFAF
jgi:hypothetical protein